MTQPRSIELLAPAKNLACGIQAIDHGADAVYIGAPQFSARAAAGNTLDDIAALTAYAHRYYARVYVALNTIIYDAELPQVEALAWQLHHIGVDALIVQDMGITRLNLPPIALHASTQADNRTAAKVAFLARAGFSQVVLARELTLDDIRNIHRAVPDTALEVFVHGALCVSYSGQCYVSHACFGRSANRGECAQFCRLPFTLTDADGTVLARDKHLLSLRDLNLIDSLELLLDAGATSLKIEGRLKEASYVKNVTAAYRRRLDDLFLRRPEYTRASSGRCTFTFTPDVGKSFNRRFTRYFLQGRQADLTSPDTPKAVGEPMGTLVRTDKETLLMHPDATPFNNGDGACFFTPDGRLVGFRINRVEGTRLYPAEPVRIAPGTTLYRNHDQAFEQQLSRPTAVRRIDLTFTLREADGDRLTLTADDEDGNTATHTFDCPRQTARTPQQDYLAAQLSKLGTTPFTLLTLHNHLPADRFLPASVLTAARREVVERLLAVREASRPRPAAAHVEDTHPYPLPAGSTLTYLGNVANSRAADFYRAHGVSVVQPAYETRPVADAALMQCKFCLRFSIGECPVHQHPAHPHRLPFYLTATDGRRFRLDFDCRQCLMTLHQA
ncbi:MAG: U32 family peptidase [Prevotellaceae bacterium]|jgi:putative protease|nr:U32 family peptidase [Prevotellaceae bacterium]